MNEGYTLEELQESMQILLEDRETFIRSLNELVANYNYIKRHPCRCDCRRDWEEKIAETERTIAEIDEDIANVRAEMQSL
ncbi:Hypothetical protein BRZCDTV_97 [Brazilian cedratvirus IHUMI]|uniref:Uncharacterized protein n=1 Tax=Brazilian cedratvirus IHUMI TaxID=2126980 RepID=A0A2R8FD86_9VIRU|nr:Hypothetical protein BRZCDTV_97 [Brazilian cedratvirus IHUMI]